MPSASVIELPKLPLGAAVEAAVDWIDANLGWLLDGISAVLGFLVDGFYDVLVAIPPVLLIIIIGVIAYFVTRRNYTIPAIVVLGLLLVFDLQLWDASMETLALVIVSTLVALVIGLPLGILAANNDVAEMIIRPILDLMQTMPSFVYLIPAVIFFGLGNVPGMIATVVFSMPPAIRLTNLGIRQISTELIEVADSFGTTARQKLIKVQLPVALPTIMAGINQTIMLALSMVVIAAMIGAGGLGYQVLWGIQRVDIGGGFEAGLGIVIVAVILDRITQNLVESP
ncbi:MAG: ABC transporter permease [Methanomicrobiales archaeon]